MRLESRIKQAITIIEAFQKLITQSDKAVELYNQFPRYIAKIILYGLEIPVIGLPTLTLQVAAQYLCILRGDTIQSSIGSDRPLYGLLHVGPPTNIIFFLNTLPLPIVNYVLAHELGHFLADVFLMRELWLKTLPEQKAAIERAFAWQEFEAMLELQAVVKGLPPRPRTITARGKAVTDETIEREIQADLIARELLAPWDRVVPLFKPNARRQITQLLYQKFGLPQRIAWHYYDDLQNYLAPPSSTLDRLFAPLLPSPPKNLPEN